MRHVTCILGTAALILTTGFGFADGLANENAADNLPAPTLANGLTETERAVSYNATYVVAGVLLAFLLVNRVNDASD